MPLASQSPPRKIRLLPLIAVTYFMVSGGPYGIEDIVGGAGYLWAIIILLLLPFFWSLPTALMIGELASAIPAEGGFYVWVRRAMGPFWGFQESWLSLSASIFDMALYPSIFVLYLGKFNSSLTADWRSYIWSLAVVAVCCAWNLLGAPRVGEDSVWMSVLLLSPFAVFILLCLGRGLTLHPAMHWGRAAAAPGAGVGLSTAILVALWNYMGWDNASTVAKEAGESAAQLSASHARRRHPHGLHLRSAACGHGGRRTLAAGLHNRFVGHGGRTHRRSCPDHGRRRRRHSLRRRHVQRPHDELHSPAHRHGGRRIIAAALHAPQSPRGALGQPAGVRPRLGAGAQSPL